MLYDNGSWSFQKLSIRICIWHQLLEETLIEFRRRTFNVSINNERENDKIDRLLKNIDNNINEYAEGFFDNVIIDNVIDQWARFSATIKIKEGWSTSRKKNWKELILWQTFISHSSSAYHKFTQKIFLDLLFPL